MKPPKKKRDTTPAESHAKIEIELTPEQAARLANFARVLKVEKVGDVILALALDSVDRAAECWKTIRSGRKTSTGSIFWKVKPFIEVSMMGALSLWNMGSPLGRKSICRRRPPLSFHSSSLKAFQRSRCGPLM
jgi:hypothetical protein